ncbi:2,3-bisphosphoglycerate-dependent phosphoglycerate mutase [Tumidithrix elongata RA019]|uniref:2,3-bisphosphoglycerate-dependent phosphoglycerate mutase n=1 Tax=Tumidithrix elongata BACA0141 TaxID=2716417 RepID=A0AAW9PXH2_9CYAN|nr:2,3-bisphosphoglycerate-dependent phosphoglycerate mutase [Tumidithrix elongata RA019]
MSKLILIRHGQSIWNAANKFTGWVDVPLSKQGRAEAIAAAGKLQNYLVNVCFTSLLIRSIETAIICLTEYDSVNGGKTPILHHDADDPQWHGWDRYEGDHTQELPIYPSAALDERYYGNLQGLNKAETVEKFGQAQVTKWRRSYDVRPPSGESLEDTLKRSVPYFRDRILTHLKHGDNVLVAAHGNSLRSIIKELDGLSNEEVINLELATAVPIVYDVDSSGQVSHKLILN